MNAPTRKQREFERREQDILAATVELITKQDWYAITMDHIAERAEIGKGTIYKHFRSKDEVAARLVTNSGRELLARWSQIDPTQPYILRFRQALQQYWEHALERADIHSVVLYCDALDETLNLSEAALAEYLGVRKQIIGFALELLEEGVRLGVLRNANVEELLLTAWGSVSGIVRMVHGGNFPGIEKKAYVAYLCDFLLAGMMNTDGRSTVH